ncbi:MAG TPA: hypothetical protein VFU21_14960 [Kofleriaceae bacterium]|nr:hypothetical protein [Kofleriaceae bacterium]
MRPDRLRPAMDLTDRLVEHEHWHTARLLEQARALPDEALDRHVRPGLVVHAFEGPEPDVRTMLHRVVFTKDRSSPRWSGAFAIATSGTTSSSTRCADVETRDPIEWERMIEAARG